MLYQRSLVFHEAFEVKDGLIIAQGLMCQAAMSHDRTIENHPFIATIIVNSFNETADFVYMEDFFLDFTLHSYTGIQDFMMFPFAKFL